MKKSCFRNEGIKPPVTLSVSLIVRDEERVLGRVLSAAVQFADELIVVDTGSKDKSIEPEIRVIATKQPLNPGLQT